ncbi:Hypothetical protein FKW44_022358 [Caligus rogercresseyi]|uniref:Uncharacterized protein n=1 Tax=Caligus rogercresseyi TaxID=217165 RepID=A0A7T8GT75_CALRO|nr:Hypothetical protein FKW44_022358 [Caligus rogercresseyi]
MRHDNHFTKTRSRTPFQDEGWDSFHEDEGRNSSHEDGPEKYLRRRGMWSPLIKTMY